MDRIKLGRSDLQVSRLCLGTMGWGSRNTEAEGHAQMDAALAGGINFVDTAEVYPTYPVKAETVGRTEEIVGSWIAKTGRRDDIVLATKVAAPNQGAVRDGEGYSGDIVQRTVDGSLKRLQTDHFDLYQMHAVNTDEDFDTITGPGGALELFREAKETGLTRYIGFSSHSAETALRLIEAIDYDSVLFPISWSTWLGADFGPQVVAASEAKGMGRLALKGMAYGKLEEGEGKKWSKCWYQPIEDPRLADLALRFTLSQAITAALPPGEPHFFRMALDIAENFTPVTADEIAELLRQTTDSKPIFELAV